MRVWVILPVLLALSGCDRSGKAVVEIDNSQMFLVPGGPIAVDPRVRVRVNKIVRRSDAGFTVHQRLVIDGPIKIVPDESAAWMRRPATQPAGTRPAGPS
ncbi:MAG: hypothetical protein LLG01_12175 [Planctomycetaceae bacterium]|nr:hypothetical protein [Planctomycetaceae bacterium]